jgi:hypothetical protein
MVKHIGKIEKTHNHNAAQYKRFASVIFFNLMIAIEQKNQVISPDHARILHQ